MSDTTTAGGGDDAELWSASAAERVSVLRARGALNAAAALCEHYLGDDRARHPRRRRLLLIERAQIRAQRGDHASASRDAAEARAGSGAVGALGTADHARLRRVEALAAADAGDYLTAARFLDEAQAAFLSIGDEASSAVLDGDRRLLAARRGSADAVSEILAAERPTTVPGLLEYALALKRRLRYEEALVVIAQIMAEHDVDDALLLPVLNELIALLALLRRGQALKALAPFGEEIWSLVRAAGQAEGTEPAARFEYAMLRVFELLERGDADRALRILADIAAAGGHRTADRASAFWYLAAGQARLIRYRRGRRESELRQAAQDIDAALRHASAEWLLDVRVRALRTSGEAAELMRRPDLAATRWAEAHELEEVLVSRQVSDEVRVKVLLDVPTEHDERIRLAARSAADAASSDSDTALAVAATIAAMESARGTAILSRIDPRRSPDSRRLPPPGDGPAASRWLRSTGDSTPSDQAIWILHATPDWVHHGIIARGAVRHVAVPAVRADLADDLDRLRACCDEHLLGIDEVRADFSDTAARIASRIGVATVLAQLPPRVRRLVVVAGGLLSEIPLAALPIPDGADGGTSPLACRFALSDLPCIAAREPLRARAAANRGDRALAVSAFDDGDPAGNGNAGRRAGRSRSRKTVLISDATADTLRDALRRTAFRSVRIFVHGQADPEDAARSWLQLSPDSPGHDGRLRPRQLDDMPLQACGTLMLGACESGIAQRVGRDERTGLVRAGLHAGAASVVAARWVAAAPAAKAVLDGFEERLRYLPRDLALQQAQLAARADPAVSAAGVPEADHPVWWACWALYGDPGYQTRARLPLRALRRLIEKARGRDASH